MAIVQISRIQIRRGQKLTGSGVPQLAGGELGWAVDTQKLYIGNGSVTEGAPAVGNTEILTEKTNIFQISGLIISVLGILAIITRLDLNILLSLNFNKGDLFMIGAIIAWGIYSAYLKKQTFNVSLLALVHIICTFGLIFLLPLFIMDVVQGETIEMSSNLFYILIYIAVFPSIGSYYCWAGAVSIIGANRAGIFLSLIPLFSTIFAILFFNEKFLFFHLIGSILIILGLFLSNKKIKNA